MLDLLPALPEMFLLAMALSILLADVYLPAKHRAVSYRLSLVALAGVGLLVGWLYPTGPTLLFQNTFIHDPMAALLKLFIVLVTFLTFIYAKAYLTDRNLFKGEYFVLGLLAVLGMLVLVSAHSLLTLYLGLELMSLSLYAMVAMYRDDRAASEAAMKYFVLGAIASGMLLYGMSLLYGVTGNLDLVGISRQIAEMNARTGYSVAEDPVLLLGLVFLLVGVAFKLGVAPFHMWVPDVYQGAPTAVTLFIGTAPKLAAFALLMRLSVTALSDLQAGWGQILILLAILSMAIGNVNAIAQTNIKRMLAYSTIAHAGFLLLGMIAGTSAGYSAALFYVIVYALMAAGGFAMILLLSRADFESDRLDDFKGLDERSPWYAFLMLILMLSMAGVPPFLGFWAKWSVLSALVAADKAWLAVVAVFFAVIGLYYYLRIVRLMYFDPPADRTPIRQGIGIRWALSANGLAILAMGLYPSALMGVCVLAITS